MRRLWRYFTGLYQWILSLTGLKTDISNLIITVSSHFYSPTVRLKKRKEIFDWVQVVKGNHRVPRTPSSFSDAWKRRNPWTVNGRRVLHAHATPPMTRSAAGRDHRGIYFFLSLSLSLSLSLYFIFFSRCTYAPFPTYENTRRGERFQWPFFVSSSDPERRFFK